MYENSKLTERILDRPFTELFNEHYDPIDEYDYYEEITMSGPFGEEYKD